MRCLIGTKLKDQNPPLPNQLKRFFFPISLLCISVSAPLPNQNPSNPKSKSSLSLLHHLYLILLNKRKDLRIDHLSDIT